MIEHPHTLNSPPRILVVDDSPTQAKLLELILDGQGYRVTVAHNGREAVEYISSDKPDLVISDILMPEMDGFELCRRIRMMAAVKNIPIILLTLLNDPADVLHSLEAGANYFISKPCDKDSLLSLVNQALQSDRSCRADEDASAVTVQYHGQSYSIGTHKDRIIDLLLATYEMTVEKNQELSNAKNALRALNQELEQRVNERTGELIAETAERLRAVEELREKDRILMHQSRQAAMGEMIGNIAHQWRQPLNTLGLLVQDIQMSYEHGGFSEEYLAATVNKIMQKIQYMSRTIDDFRNFFRPDKEKSAFKVRQNVARTLSLVEENFSTRQIKIDIVAEDDPAVTGYPNEYSQVLLNILGNAADAFQEQNTVNPHIVVKIFTSDGRTVVSITDNAGGIREGVIDRIFEPYYTTKEQGKGTGVGLYMAKNIIEKSMNGRLSVRNTGQGAEFRIEV